MAHFEYKTVPAPTRANKIKGIKGDADRMALTLDELLNTEAQKGWHYAGSESLPCARRKGLFGGAEMVATSFLIFRREKEVAAVVPTHGLGSVHDI